MGGMAAERPDAGTPGCPASAAEGSAGGDEAAGAEASDEVGGAEGACEAGGAEGDRIG